MTEIITRNTNAAELTYLQGDNQVAAPNRTTTINLTLNQTHNREVVVFNGADLVATLTASATLTAALNATSSGDQVGYFVTLVNINSTDLRITSATNIDGSADDIYIPQYSSITISYDTTGTQYVTLNKPNAVFVNNSNGNPNSSDTRLDPAASLTHETWTTVGPTGSGATVIWTALDSVPLNVDWIDVKTRVDANSSAGPTASLTLWSRGAGSAETNDADTRIAGGTLTTGAAGTTRLNVITPSKIPVNASNVFELFWSRAGATNDTTEELIMNYIGYGWNK